MYTQDLTINYTRNAPGADRLRAKSDTNWKERRSVSGGIVKYAGANIRGRTRKQHAIAMSSCEAELMGLADMALELVYLYYVFEHLGVQFDEKPELETDQPDSHALIERALKVHGPIEVETDAQSAYNLTQRDSPGVNTKHVARRVFKMRELAARKIVSVRLVRTDEMEADIMTKILERQPFEKHRDSIMNAAAKLRERVKEVKSQAATSSES